MYIISLKVKFNLYVFLVKYILYSKHYLHDKANL